MYDNPVDYHTYVLVFNQCLNFGEKIRGHALLNPNQMRMNGVQVADCPQFLEPNQTDLSNLIYVPEHDLHIPLHLDGVIGYFPFCQCKRAKYKKAKKAYDDKDQASDFVLVEMMSSTVWDPYSIEFARCKQEYFRDMLNPNAFDLLPEFVMNEVTFIAALSHSVLIDSEHMQLIAAGKSGMQKGTVTAKQLTVHWQIGLELVQQTIEQMTQCGIHDFTHSK